MTDLDLDEIRQAMEDEPYMGFTWACKWLLALCDEVERLRAERDALRVDNDRLRRDIAMGVDEANRMLETIEDLRNDLA